MGLHLVKITRREFLGSSTAALAFGNASALGALEIREVSGGVVVTEGDGLRWRLEDRAFGPSASVSKTGETSIEIAQIALSADLETSLALSFEPDAGGWTLQCTWTDWGQSSARLMFGRFLHGEPLATTLNPSTLATFKDATSFNLPSHVDLEVYRNASTVLRPLKGNLSLVGGTFRPTALLVGPRPSNFPAWRGEFVNPFKGQSVRLGACHGVTAAIELDPRARLILQTGENPVRIQGDLVLRLRNKVEDLSAPIEAAEFQQVGSKRHARLFCKQSHWPFKSRVGTFDLGGEDDGKPFVVRVTNVGDTVTYFDMRSLLFNHNIAVPGSDRTRLDFVDPSDRAAFNRLDFKGASFKIFLPGLSGDRTKFGYEFGNAASTVRIGLDDAKLRIARARDLMNLEFRFKNIDLEVRGGKPYLIGRKVEGADADRVIVVDLPPQHIMEQAFLRQQFDLPDADPHISASDLGRLRTSSQEDVLRLRLQIRDSKIAAEKNDPGNAGLTPFADFSRLWDADPQKEVPPREKFWIGPLGLVSVQGRQAARRIFARARRSDMDQVLGDLGKDRSPADTDKDIEKAVRLISAPSHRDRCAQAERDRRT